MFLICVSNSFIQFVPTCAEHDQDIEWNQLLAMTNFTLCVDERKAVNYVPFNTQQGNDQIM